MIKTISGVDLENYIILNLRLSLNKMSGGGGAKKFIVTMFVDHPGKVYLGGAAFLYF